MPLHRSRRRAWPTPCLRSPDRRRGTEHRALLSGSRRYHARPRPPAILEHRDHRRARGASRRRTRRRPGRETRPGGSTSSVLALGALLLRIPALLAPTNLGYDDGGYGARRDRDAPGLRAVPRHLLVARARCSSRWCTLADLAGFQTLDAPRLLPVLAGAVTTVAVYCAGRELMDRGRALLAGALAATSGVLLWTTGPLTSDGTGAAISVSRGRGRARLPPPAVDARSRSRSRVLAGSAFSVKNLLVTPGARHRVAPRRVRAGGSSTPSLVPLGALAVLVARVGAVGLQRRLPTTRSSTTSTRPARATAAATLSKLVTTYLRRSTLLVGLGVVGLVTALVANALGRPRAGRSSPAATAAPAPATCRSTGALGAGSPRARILWWWAGLVLVVLLSRTRCSATTSPRSSRRSRCSSPGTGRRGAPSRSPRSSPLPFQACQLQPAARARGLLGRRGDGRRSRCARCPTARGR